MDVQFFSAECEKNGKCTKIHYSCVIIIIVYDLIEKNIWLKKKELLLLASTQTHLIKWSKDIPLFSLHFWLKKKKKKKEKEKSQSPIN